MTKEKRDDAPRDGAVRFTVITEKRYVNFLKSYAAKNKLKITSVVGDCFEQFIERLKSGNKRD
jgi:hypothetical protein